jgi:hypothetical protein
MYINNKAYYCMYEYAESTVNKINKILYAKFKVIYMSKYIHNTHSRLLQGLDFGKSVTF